VGYKISPILWQIFYYGLSAGRVQTVGLRLVCEREAEIEAFVAVEYWTVEGILLTPAGAELPVKLIEKKGEKVDLTPQERRELAGVLRSLVETYREGVNKHVKGRTTHH